MTLRFQRANALPETALIVSVVLLLLYSGVQMAVAGFTQVSVDGAAFVAARSTVQHYSSGADASQSAVKTFAGNVANAVFNHVLPRDVTVSNPTTTSFETTISKTIPGFSLVPHAGNVTVTGRDVEAQGPTTVGNGGLLTGVNVPTLPNSTKCPTIYGVSNATTGGATNLASQVANQIASGSGDTSDLQGVFSDIDSFLTPLSTLLGTNGGSTGSPLANGVTNSISTSVSQTISSLGSVLGLLAPQISTTLNASLSADVGGPNGGLVNAVESAIQDVTNQALTGQSPNTTDMVTALTNRLTTELTRVLGPIPLLNGLLSKIVTPLAQSLAQNINANAALGNLIPPLDHIAGDHGRITRLLNGKCV